MSSIRPLIIIMILSLAATLAQGAKPALYEQKRKTKKEIRPLVKYPLLKRTDKKSDVKKYLPFESSRSRLITKEASTKKPEELRAIYNDIRDTGSDDEEEFYDYRSNNESSSDLAGIGGDIKTVIKKHHFTLSGTPHSIQGLPIIYTSKGTGFNVGARISVANIRYEDPYTYKLSLQYWSSDRGSRNHELSLDIPHFFSYNWHVRIAYTYPRSITQKYYGVGNDSVNNKEFTDPDSSEFKSRTYYQYIQTYPKLAFDIEYTIPNQDISIYTGFALDKASIDPHNKDASSKIYSEQPYGYQGGKTNYIKAGIKYDSRDYPFNPMSGITIAGTYTNHAKFMKSDYEHSNVNLVYMGFFSFWRYFTLSQRVMAEQMWGDMPFFSLSEFRSYNDYNGLGGSDFLRGAPSYRYIDNLKFVNQFELRTRIFNGKIFSQRVMIHFNPFWDMGRVWDNKKKFTLNNFHHSFGNEFRFTWNDNFIVSFTFGVSGDGMATYLTFGESFI
jgi:hypothetical protein